MHINRARSKKRLHNFIAKTKYYLTPPKKLHADGTLLDGRGDVANLPTCGPFLILFPALKRWGPPRWHGLCSQFAPL